MKKKNSKIKVEPYWNVNFANAWNKEGQNTN